jgi:serine phosphatase RsbU (regulator of sigma subunit)
MGSSPTTPDLLPVTWSNLEGTDLYAAHDLSNRGADFYDGLTVGGRVLFLMADIGAAQPKVREVAHKAQIVFRKTAQALFASEDANESDAVAEIAHAVNLALILAAGGACPSPAFLGCFNQALGILTYLSGGDLLALFRERNQVNALAPSGMSFGLFTHTTFEPAVMALQEGDALLLTTRGVSGSKRGREEFGVERIKRFLLDARSLSAAEICRGVLQQSHDFAKVPWWSIPAHLEARKQAAHQDRCALALLRHSH